MQYGAPGVSAAQFTTDAELFWGGDESRINILRKGVRVSTASVDAGASPTSRLRKGLIMGMITATRERKQWDPAATDGSQQIDSVLEVETPVLDFQSGLGKQGNPPVIVSAPVKASALLILGNAFLGNANEFAARRQMHLMGFRFDDDPAGYLAGVTQRSRTVIADTVVVAADNGTRFLAETANVLFTLPAIRAGLTYEFLRISDHNMTIASAEGDNVIVGNDSQADSVAFTTAGQKVGARVRVLGISTTAGLRWLTEIIPVPFGTGAFLTQGLAT